LYYYLDGHLYFGNKVIKVRFDLNKKNRTHDFNESELFDEYSNIFDLKDHESFLSLSPLCSYGNRLAYVKRNKDDLESHEIMIVPFLHENRVYLNRLKKNNEYFYTLITDEK
jgi:hypothetical protein